MARLPADEIQKLKDHISLLRLVESQGYTPQKQGKDYAIKCPFHEDDTPSLIISPTKNLYHCFGCNAGGTVIDWVMKTNGVSFRHAVELLQKDLSVLASQTNLANTHGNVTKRSRAAKLAPLDVNADDQAMLKRVIDYYHETLLQSPEALAYLEQRGLNDPALIQHFKIGFANRTLGYRLQPNTNQLGQALRGQLQRLGIYRTSGHEHLNGSIVIPIYDQQNNIVQAYGRKITTGLRKGTPLHVYLPQPQRGVFNAEVLKDTNELILCEALIDALTFWVNGFKHVTCSYGVHGFTDELLQSILDHKIKTVLIAYDRDDAGQQAAEQLAKKLTEQGIDCYRVLFPKNMDVNAYALSVQPADKSLGVALRSATWMGKGKAPTQPKRIDPKKSMQVVKNIKENDIKKIKTDPELDCTLPEPLPAILSPEPSQEASSVLPATPKIDVHADITDTDVQFTFGERFYRVRGLSKNLSYEQLKVNLLVSCHEVLHVDTFDLYSARHRQSFTQHAATELGLDVRVIKSDIGKVLLKCEALQEEQIKAKHDADNPNQPVALSDDEHQAALTLLQSPDLLNTITDDIEHCGLVGERTNTLASYLACITRKLSGPLAILVQSTSAAGKSSLMDAVLAMMPPEERVHYSAMTGQSLFYMGETHLKHKILAISEEEGANQASYALKLLQSEGELTIASTGKDDATGNLVTKEYRVEGPVMLFLTTTAIDIDEELLNRCLVLTINETREQTQAIHQLQRQKRTLEGLQRQQDKQHIINLHRNAQRLLKPLHVLNPYAERLTFLDNQTRMRRDHEKYLTLIDSIALLHQHQREIKTLTRHDESIEYVEVTVDDISIANQLAHKILGRTLDELPPQTRKLLNNIYTMVNTLCTTQNIAQHDVRFSRREVREAIGWGNTQLKTHLARLVDMEYCLIHNSGHKQTYHYELRYQDEGQHTNTFMMGLIDPDTLTLDDNRSGQNHLRPGCGRPAVGVQSGSGRDTEKGKTKTDSSTYATTNKSSPKSTSTPKKK